MTVLDLCCGYGHFTAPLARMTEGRVYALDLDPGLLAQARMAVARQGARVQAWICADAMDVAALLPERVDYALVASTFHGIRDHAAFLDAVAAAVTPGGRLGIINWQPRDREETVFLGKPRGPRTELRLAPEQVRQMVQPGGFALERIVDLPPYHYGAVFRLTHPASLATRPVARQPQREA